MEKNTTILEIEDIHTYYGRSHILQGVSLYVEAGEPVSILGRNGVGKTTTLRTIIGLSPPQSGSIKFKGQQTSKWPPHKISRLGVAYVPAERDVFPGLNVEENLSIASRRSDGKESWNLARIYEHFPLLQERCKQEASTLSGGEQQLLAIARAIMSNPQLMLLDEPSEGLSPVMIKKVSEVIQYCIASGITVLLVEQNYRMALQIASRHYLMGNKGVIAKTASSEELTADPQIIQDHLSV